MASGRARRLSAPSASRLASRVSGTPSNTTSAAASAAAASVAADQSMRAGDARHCGAPALAAEFSQEPQAGADFRLRLGPQLRPSARARLEIDEVIVAGIGECHGDAAPHAAGAHARRCAASLIARPRRAAAPAAAPRSRPARPSASSVRGPWRRSRPMIAPTDAPAGRARSAPPRRPSAPPRRGRRDRVRCPRACSGGCAGRCSRASRRDSMSFLCASPYIQRSLS